MEHINAVDADFRVFYGIDGIGDGYIPDDISGPRFIALCEALPGYKGATRLWMEAVAAEEAEHAAGGRPNRTTTGGTPYGQGGFQVPAAQVQEVSDTAALTMGAFGAAPELNQPPIFEVRKAQ